MTKKKICLAAAVGILLHIHTTYAQTDSTKNKTINVPVRIGIAPGFSTQGNKDVHTTSNVSLNIYGGMTGSINGIELGSLFNINKKNMQYVQAAGLFNLTGGYAKGVQLSGLFNAVEGQLMGVQYAGLTNYVAKDVYGIQSAGIHNQTGGQIKGLQSAGISNYAGQNVQGIQLAGIVNISRRKLTGLQAAGILNYTKHLKGLQIGLINIADTSEGFSLGLINIVRKGYHKIAISSNEVLNANLSIKTGNAKMYNILLVGVNAGNNDKSFSYGYGIGHEMKLGNRFTLNPELTTQYVYLGNWNYHNQLSRLQVLANIKLGKNIALFGGPAYSAYYSDQPSAVKGYKFNLSADGFGASKLWNDNVMGWFGWTAGISFL
jgi:hypothetical protein